MGLKFLNKKGWHTGSLRNIENVWKAEQKHEAEQRKLEELRKQIHEERERDQFRLLQEQAGLTPRQERLEFLYDSGLAVGRSTSDGFKALQPSPSASAPAPSSAPDSSNSSVPGALFEDKPQSANDTWRKLHSDPLLMIRQREQEALARIKNNPVKMAVIRKSVEAKKKNDESLEEEHQKVKSKHRKHSTSKYDSDSENDSHEETERKEKEKKKKKDHLDSDKDSRDRPRHHRHSHRDREGEKQRHSSQSKHKSDRSQEDARDRERHDNRHSRRDHGSEDVEKQRHSSPSKHKSDRSQEDARDRERHDNRHSRRDHGSEDVEKQRHSSPSKHKSDRSQENARDRERHDNRHSRRDHGSEDVEKQRHSSPSKHKSDRSQEDARDRERHNNRHSRRDYGSEDVEQNKRSYEKAKHEDNTQDHQNDKYEYKARNDGCSRQVSDSNHSGLPPRPDSYKRRGRAPQLSEEERTARLREMQMDAEVHEEQRWKRLKKADEDDVREASHANNSNRGGSFLDSVQKSVYGAEKGGSSTIEESVRRRSHFLQGSREATERNAFRR